MSEAIGAARPCGSSTAISVISSERGRWRRRRRRRRPGGGAPPPSPRARPSAAPLHHWLRRRLPPRAPWGPPRVPRPRRAILGTSASSASCCNEKLNEVARAEQRPMLHRASLGMSCECWLLLCKCRAACIMYACRSYWHTAAPLIPRISPCCQAAVPCTGVTVLCCSAAWAVPVGS